MNRLHKSIAAYNRRPCLYKWWWDTHLKARMLRCPLEEDPLFQVAIRLFDYCVNAKIVSQKHLENRVNFWKGKLLANKHRTLQMIEAHRDFMVDKTRSVDSMTSTFERHINHIMTLITTKLVATKTIVSFEEGMKQAVE